MITFSKDVAPEGRQLKFSQAGERTWCDFYDSIDDTQSGVVASLLARTEAHVLWLAMIFTAFDNSCSIEPKHINAAIAFWRYCEASVRWVFGNATGNPLADKIRKALQRAPGRRLSRTDITHGLLGRNASKADVDKALSMLVAAKHADVDLEGKTEWWFAR